MPKVFLALSILLSLICPSCSAKTEEAPDPSSSSAPVEQLVSPKPAEEPPAQKYDFSDSSHWNLTVSAWEKMAEKDYEGVFAFAKKCLELYEEQARREAAGMRGFARIGREDDYQLINDVAASHYIMGEANMRLGNNESALSEFNLIIKEYPFVQCWDPKGWFWKVAEISKKNIEKIERLGARGR